MRASVAYDIATKNTRRRFCSLFVNFQSASDFSHRWRTFATRMVARCRFLKTLFRFVWPNFLCRPMFEGRIPLELGLLGKLKWINLMYNNLSGKGCENGGLDPQMKLFHGGLHVPVYPLT